MPAPSKAKAKKPRKAPLVIGWREMVQLPALGLGPFKAKVDTGARTAALHASDITAEIRDGIAGVRFHPCHMGLERARMCWAPIHDQRAIRNTSGIPQERYVIRTALRLGDREFLAEISLADRADMRFPMILGRSTLRGHRILINCGRSWLTGGDPGPLPSPARSSP